MATHQDRATEEASFRKRCKLSDEDWRVFTTGTDEEQEEWRDRQRVIADPLPDPLVDIVEPDSD